ncbi:MAG TPA: Ig-like domain-containing protein, partial [Thermoplasmata archaeon]|nr:Ig-like domain-containing protein [Thermoplasmata archaeon]
TVGPGSSPDGPLAIAEALNDSLEFAPCGSTTPCNGWTRTLLQSTQIQWEHGAATKSGGAAPAAHSGSYAYVTRLAVGYASGSTANRAEELRSPAFNLANAQSATLTFWHWHDIEINTGTNYCDGARVDVSTNGGASWTAIAPNGGYPGNVGDGGFACGVTYLEGAQAFGGLSGGWVQKTFNLNSYLGSANTHVRFVFAQDPLTGIGGWYIDDVVVSYVPAGTPPTVTVTSPNGGEQWVAQSTHQITWSVNPGTNPLQANSAILSYSSSGCGGSFSSLATNQPNSGPYDWTLPTATTSSACIRVSVDDTMSLRGTDTSDSAFQVIAATSPAVSVTRPNGGESFVISQGANLNWTAGPGSFPLAANPITLSYSTTGPAGTYNVIATGLANSGSYLWTVPNAPSTNSFVKVEARDDRTTPNTGSDLSDAAFSISTAAPPTVTVQQPNGAESLSAGSVYPVRWTAAPGTYPLAVDPITVEYSSSGCAGGWTQAATALPNSGSYNWNVPATPNNSSCIRVQAKDNQGTPTIGSDTSDAVFSIAIGNAAPVVTLVSPSAGGYAKGNRTLVFEGSDANRDTVSYVVRLSADSGATWVQIFSGAYPEQPTPTAHPVPFDTVGYADRTTYRLQVEANDGNGSALNVSHPSDFTIDNAAPQSTMTQLAAYTKSIDIPLNWSSSDATAGLSSVEIWVREGGGQKRVHWNATNASGMFHGREGYDYEFWAIGWDKAGNVENKSVPDTKTKVDSVVPTSSVKPLPKYSPALSIQVGFNYVDASTGKTTIWWTESGTGQWSPAGPFAQSPGTITVPGEGKFEFYSTAVDDAGNAETKQPAAEAETIIDSRPPDGAIMLKTPLVSTTKARVSVSATDGVELARVAVEWANASDPSQTGVGWEQLLPPGLKTFSGEPDVSLPGGGEFLLTFNATDRAGGSARFDGGRVRVDVVPPTVATSPAPGQSNVSVPAVFAFTFSEPMNRTGLESSLRVLRGTAPAGSVSGVVWKSDTEASAMIDGLEGKTLYTLVISLSASPLRDVAGNAMKETRVTFTTIPIRGDITGTVKEAGGGSVRDATVRLT